MAGCPATPLQISVVICVRDDWRVVRLLQSLQMQTVDPSRFEVVVVLSGGEDYGLAAWKPPFEIALVRCERLGVAPARVLGLERVRGRYFATTDADCVTDPRWLEAYLDAFSGGGDALVGVGGQIRKYALDTMVRRHGITINDGQKGLQYLPASPLPYITGANAAYRTDAVRAVGGYDASFSCGEDVDISYRLGLAGGKLEVIPDAVVWHQDRATLSAHFQRWYAVDQALLFKRYRAGTGRTYNLNPYPWRRLGQAVGCVGRGWPRIRRGDFAPLATACTIVAEAAGVIAGDIEGSLRHRVIYV